MKRKTTWMLLIVLTASVLIFLWYVMMDRAATDRTAPEIVMDATEISLSVQDPESALLLGMTARDDVDGDVTDTLIVESIYGITKTQYITVKYAVSDQAGNVAKAERTARYTDYQSPRLTLSAPLVFEFSRAWDVMDVIGATDVFDGDIQRRIKAAMLSSGTSVTEEGIHDVQFQVTNSIGDTVQLVLPVEVYPVDSYNAQLRLTDYLIYLPLGSEIHAEDYLLEFETRRDLLNLSRGVPGDLHLQITEAVDTQTPGVYPVTYTATYTDGGVTYTGYTKLLVVVEGQGSV